MTQDVRIGLNSEKVDTPLTMHDMAQAASTWLPRKLRTPLLWWTRTCIFFLMLLTLSTFSYYLALGLRFEFQASDMFLPERFITPLPILLSLRFVAYYLMRPDRSSLRYFSGYELSVLAKAHITSSFAFIAIIGFLRVPNFPRSVVFIELALSLLLAVCLRHTIASLTRSWVHNRKQAQKKDQKVLVLGAGDSGHLVVTNLKGHPQLPYRPVGIS